MAARLRPRLLLVVVVLLLLMVVVVAVLLLLVGGVKAWLNTYPEYTQGPLLRMKRLSFAKILSPSGQLLADS